MHSLLSLSSPIVERNHVLGTILFGQVELKTQGDIAPSCFPDGMPMFVTDYKSILFQNTDRFLSYISKIQIIKQEFGYNVIDTYST